MKKFAATSPKNSTAAKMVRRERSNHGSPLHVLTPCYQLHFLWQERRRECIYFEHIIFWVVKDITAAVEALLDTCIAEDPKKARKMARPI